MMKRLIYVASTIAVLLCGSVIARAQATVEVTLSNIRSDKGSLRVGLFTESEFFTTPAIGKIVKSQKGNVTIVFEDVKPGTYAIGVIHDENENGVIDRTKLGIPKEGFAFGNNALGKKGPPTFEKAKLVVSTTAVKQLLNMKYF